jgi:hypothetical protein
MKKSIQFIERKEKKRKETFSLFFIQSFILSLILFLCFNGLALSVAKNYFSSLSFILSFKHSIHFN